MKQLDPLINVYRNNFKMKTYRINRFFGIAVLALLSFSCSSELDFGQTEFFFDKPESFFVDTNGDEKNVSVDEQIFQVFYDQSFKLNTDKVELLFEFTNTIDRNYTLELIFMGPESPDPALQYGPNIELFRETFEIPAGPSGSIPSAEMRVYQNDNVNPGNNNDELDKLKRSKVIAFWLYMDAGTTIDPSNNINSLKLRSSATVYSLFK
jgi:hypothetical protein